MALDIGQAWSVGPGFLRGLRRSSRRGRAICITVSVARRSMPAWGRSWSSSDSGELMRSSMMSFSSHTALNGTRAMAGCTCKVEVFPIRLHTSVKSSIITACLRSSACASCATLIDTAMPSGRPMRRERTSLCSSTRSSDALSCDAC